MKRIATLALLVITFASLLVAGTTGKISGTVTDATNGEKLVGVNVVLDGTRIGGTTDIDGAFVIINVPSGVYRLKASLVGYNTASVLNVRVNIDENTIQNFSLKQSDLQAEEVVIVAQRPVVQKDVAASRANITVEEVQNLPVASVTAAIGYQAGVQSGLVIRGGGSDQTLFMVDGLTMRDQRTNSPYTGISLSSVQDIQVQTGGFSAEYGDLRSGVVNVITREGGKNYSFSFTGRYSPATAKNFGGSIFGPNSYFIRPLIDDAVAWTGTKNGAWNFFQQKEYRAFDGWNSIAEKTLSDPDPSKHLTPEAAKELFLFQHRKSGDIVKPDWDMDLGFGGPVPMISENLGNLRFYASYRQSRSMYVIPLATPDYNDYNGQIKITSDISGGMKLMISGLMGYQHGTNSNNTGAAGLFTTVGGVASAITSGGSFADARLYSDAYWAPSTIEQNQWGAKFTHVLSPKTFYEVSINQVGYQWNTNPGRARNTDSIYVFGNGYKTDEGPFGFIGATTTGIDGLRMSVGFSNSRDTSKLISTSMKFDFESQLDRYNKLRSGFEVQYSDNAVNYAQIDLYLPRSNTTSSWRNFPIRGGLYATDKIEYEGMIAELGLRLDYSDPQGEWYSYAPYDKAFTGPLSPGIDTLLVKHAVEKQLYLSPRLAISFPVTDYSKLYFNYGHMRQMPTPTNLFLLRRSSFDQKVSFIADPNNTLQKTVAYELGYEQSILDQFLIRIAGYYKDVTDESNTVTYVSRQADVSYSRSVPTTYEDIRGFELTLEKNRGDWFTTKLNYTYMASTSGQFGYSYAYEFANAQRDYESLHRETDLYQTKNAPVPYARAIVDLFTPGDYNPLEWGKPLQLMNDWRLNLVGTWSAGSHFTWVGGGSISGIRNNMQYRDNYGCDMRLTKNFKLMNAVNLQLIMDVSNLFNIKNFSGYGFIEQDFNEYMRSLHMPSDKVDDALFGYINVPGSDKPGDIRQDGVAWTPIQSTANVATVTSPFPAGVCIYYDKATQSFVEFKDNAWVAVDQARIDKMNETKSYIRMPSLPSLMYLNPRDIYYGVKLTLDL